MTAGTDLETRAETGAVRDAEVVTEARDEEPETKHTAAGFSELGEEPEEESETPGILSSAATGLFWGG